MELTKMCKLKWVNGNLVSYSRQIGKQDASTTLVDVEKFLEWLDGKKTKELTPFEVINKLDPVAADWVMCQTMNGSPIPESRYTQLLWDVTVLQLIDFVRKGAKNALE